MSLNKGMAKYPDSSNLSRHTEDNHFPYQRSNCFSLRLTVDPNRAKSGACDDQTTQGKAITIRADAMQVYQRTLNARLGPELQITEEYNPMTGLSYLDFILQQTNVKYTIIR